MANKETMIMYESTYRAIELLLTDDKDWREAVSGLLKYGFYDQMPESTNPLIQSIFIQAIPPMEKSKQKYATIVGHATKENFNQTRQIIEYHEAHPDYSQDKISIELGISKGKVNKVLQRYNAIPDDLTGKYIKKYLIPLGEEDIKIFEFDSDTFLNITDIDNNRGAEYIKQMKYKDFLFTPYWLMISDYVKTKLHNNKCNKCGVSTHLQTHHLTYDRHGYEHTKDVMENDLVVLCSLCHKKAHNIDN